ncbi:methylmalonyl-CoA mutase family protein [Echinicola soli]|nr:methylmalonyl-CoA mutase family protein [Echinicola soli]
MTDKDFYGFPPPAKQDWIEQALHDTGVREFDELVLWDALEQLPYAPFYTEEDLGPSKRNPAGFLERSHPHYWENVALVDLDKDTPEIIASVISNGIDGLVVQWSGKGDLNSLLSDIQPAYVSIWLKPTGEVKTVVTNFLSWIESRLSDRSMLSGGILWDPWAEGLHQERPKGVVEEEAIWLHAATKEFPDFKGICMDFAIYRARGVNATREITLGFGVLVELLDLLTAQGAAVTEVLDNLFVQLATGNDYFLQIAKMKTVRVLFGKFLMLYDIKWSENDSLHVFSTTSDFNRNDEDAYNNMVRNTVEAMMAILGGADTLWVKVHGDESVPVFARRIAANISNLLKYESHFDEMGDATSGAFYLAYLMDVILEKVESGLVQQEESGGWWAMISAFSQNKKSNDNEA